MESRILSQLITLKKTAMELTTATRPEARAPFSGFSVVIKMVMKDIPDSLPRSGASSLLYRLIRPVHHSVMLLNAISLTISHGFLGKASSVLLSLSPHTYSHHISSHTYSHHISSHFPLHPPDPCHPLPTLEVLPLICSHLPLICSHLPLVCLSLHPLAGRCRSVAWALNHLGVSLVSLVVRQAISKRGE